MKLTKHILVKTTFIGYHNWPDAPEDVIFLKHPHRHVFTVILRIPVSHSNRQLEFFQVQRKLREMLMDWYDEQDLGMFSCEDIAGSILHEMKDSHDILCSSVQVWEDMENGAEAFAPLEISDAP